MFSLKSLVEKAKEFAINAHGDQDHGSLKVIDHLTEVTSKLEHYLISNRLNTMYNTDSVLATGWLHDTLEDTKVTYRDLFNNFGDDIAEYVLAVTDGNGHSRMERHLNTYYRTRKYEESIIVKLADRWHNHKRSLEYNEYNYANDYKNEYIYFKFALYNPMALFVSLWEELDVQYEDLKHCTKNK